MKKRAFTLIELLVVIAIIGILTGIVLVSLRGARTRAYDAEIKSEISQIRSDAEAYYTDHGDYAAYTVPAQFKPPTCSQTDYSVSTSSDAQSIAICARLCSDPSKYWCVDSQGNAIATSSCPAAGSGKCQ